MTDQDVAKTYRLGKNETDETFAHQIERHEKEASSDEELKKTKERT